MDNSKHVVDTENVRPSLTYVYPHLKPAKEEGSEERPPSPGIKVQKPHMRERMRNLAKYEKYQVKLTEWEAFVSTFKALVGIGILSCPSAYKDVGLLGGIIGNIIIMIVFNLLYT